MDESKQSDEDSDDDLLDFESDSDDDGNELRSNYFCLFYTYPRLILLQIGF